MTKSKKENVRNELQKLEDIVAWFEEREEVNLEESVRRVREGSEIIKLLREQLKETENELKEIKKGLMENE